MCLTNKSTIYSWGKCGHGRLGHEDPVDLTSPSEIYMLSQRKPIFIACGDSHSAAISEKLQLFTWGNPGYGRLGHDTDDKVITPTLVEKLRSQKVVWVSCGFNHTLAVSMSKQGKKMWAFGQNKYGKLGIHYQKSMDATKNATYDVPVGISCYREEGSKIVPADPPVDISEVCAGYNHSLALTRKGKPHSWYSWGYYGKSVLGRRLKRDQKISALVALPVVPHQEGKDKKN